MGGISDFGFSPAHPNSAGILWDSRPSDPPPAGWRHPRRRRPPRFQAIFEPQRAASSQRPRKGLSWPGRRELLALFGPKCAV